MTKERAISLLRCYRQAELSKPEHYSFAKWTMYKFGERSYAKSIVAEVIGRIKNSPDSEDPLRVVHDFICWIDSIRLTNQKEIKNEFIGEVMKIADDIEQYLGEDEIKRIKEETNV